MKDWNNIKEEIKLNSHLFRIMKTSRIEVKASDDNTKYIEILVENDTKAVIHKSDIEFLAEYCDSYDLTFWIVEKPFAIYMVEN